MTITCSWCGKQLGEQEPKEDHRITHGICKECVDELLKEIEEEKENPDTL